MIKAYAMIWERCTKGMKQKIEARIDRIIEGSKRAHAEISRALIQHVDSA